MNPQLAILILEEAIKYTPALVQEIQTLFSAGTPTPEQFDALRQKIANESYAAAVPGSAIPAGQ